jgi:hypothetical protein
MLDRDLGSISEAVAAGDVERVLATLESLADLAAFIRMADKTAAVVPYAAPEATERARFISALRARADSLRDWAGRARRLAKLAITLQHDTAYWPGRGATRGSQRWRIAHDSLEVIVHLALPLARVAEGDGKEPAGLLAKAVASMLDPDAIARSAEEARNIVRGGRRDTSRGRDLRDTCSMIGGYLLIGEELDDETFSRWLLSSLADRFGDAFRERSVLAACMGSLARNRTRGAIPTIATEVVLAAWSAARERGATVAYFRFPVGDDLDTRARKATASARRERPGSRVQMTAKRVLMQDFAKARRARSGSVH